jgi:rhodanese-related sulfurtransferase
MDELEVPQVTPAEAAILVEGGALLVDVREQNEWDAARIPGAVLKPMSLVGDWYEDLPIDITVVLQCRSGARSNNIAEALIGKVGMTNIANLAGGIVEWSEVGLPIDDFSL